MTHWLELLAATLLGGWAALLLNRPDNTAQLYVRRCMRCDRLETRNGWKHQNNPPHTETILHVCGNCPK